MNQTLIDLVKFGATAIGGGGVVLAAIVARKPRRTIEAEAQASVAQSQVSLATAFQVLVADLQDEIARKDGEFLKLSLDLNKLRHRVTGLQEFGGAVLQHVDALETLVIKLGGTPPPRPTFSEVV